MKILFVGDVHWCSQSSIVRGMGTKYSIRLENLIKSVNWCEQLAQDHNVYLIVYAGDFFDQPILNAEEISALNELQWSERRRAFLVGNHELGRHDRTFSSAHLFDSFPMSTVISQPTEWNCGSKRCYFLPYFLEKDRPELPDGVDYIFSHNDIKGVQMGRFVSDVGFNQSEIESKCKYFFNGHLHNGTFVGNNIINIGNLSGQNFSEDATVYSHNVVILDTTTDELKFFENPHAFNFYKLGVIEKLSQLPQLKNNAVVTLTTSPDNEEVKNWIENCPNIICKRILFSQGTTEKVITTSEFTAVNHLDKFVEFIQDNMEMTNVVKEELNMVVSL